MDRETINLTESFALTIFGKPGAGKSKQAQWLARRLEMPLIDMGELLRDCLASGTVPEIQEAVSAGALISSQMCFDILKQHFKSLNITRGYLLVGFPRSSEQIVLYQELSKLFPCDRELHILLEVSDDIARSRAKGRRNKALKQGRVRSDDKQDVFERRLQSYYDVTVRVIQELETQFPRRMIKIDAARSKNREVLKTCLEAFEDSK